MAPIAQPIFAGSLQPKKKAELQQIALALSLSDSGTNYDLQQRIKKHLENNPDLEETEAFRGLYGRRGTRTSRGSVQPTEAVKTRGRFALYEDDDEKPVEHSTPSRRSTKRVTPLDPIHEFQSPQRDERNISSILKHPASPGDEPEAESDVVDEPPLVSSSPTRAYLVPRSPQRGANKHHVVALPPTPDPPPPQPPRLQRLVTRAQSTITSTRAFLSNAANISILITEIELVYILVTIIPWKVTYYTLTPDLIIQIPSFPLIILTQPVLYLTLLHWAFPTVIVPWLVGLLVSFRYPAPSDTAASTEVTLATPPPQLGTLLTPFKFDGLSATVARFACHVAYPYDKLHGTLYFTPPDRLIPLPTPTPPVLINMDVLGARWRLVDAGIVLACALAEALFEGQKKQRLRSQHPSQSEQL